MYLKATMLAKWQQWLQRFDISQCKVFPGKSNPDYIYRIEPLRKALRPFLVTFRLML